MMKRLLFILTSAFILFSNTGFSQVIVDTLNYIHFEDIYIKHYTTKNGLSQNSVGSINVDEDGYLWVFDEDNIHRFDGENFISNYPFRVSKDVYNHLDGGIRIKGAKSDKGRLIQDTTTHRKALLSTSEQFFFRDSLRLSAAEKKFYNNNKIMRTQSGDFYTYSDKGVLHKNGNVWDTISKVKLRDHYAFPYDSSFFVFDQNNQLLEFKNGELFNQYTLKGISPQFKFIWNHSPNAVYFLDKKKLYRFHLNNGKPTLELWIKNLDITGLTRVLELKDTDSSDIFFLGTRSNGFYYCRPKQMESRGLSLNTGETNLVYAHVEIGKDNTLAGSGVIINKDESYRILSPKAISNRRLTIDKKGRIWTTSDLDRWGQTGFYESKPTLNLEHVVLNDAPLNLIEDKNGTIWGLGNDTIFRFNEKEKHLEAIQVLPFSTVNMLPAYDSFNHSIWILFQRGGFHYDITSNKISSIDVFKGLRPRSIHFSDHNTMWLATKKDGLFVYYNDSLYTLPLDRNGYLLSAHCILEDDHGFFWISCNRGVFQVSKSDLLAFIKGETENVYYYLWGLNDGIDGYELNGGCSPCGLKLESGLFSFPSLNGIVQFNPIEVKPILPEKPIYITAFRINERDTLLEKNSRLESDLELLEFEISAPYFGEKINDGNLEYKLEGLHNKWYPIRNDKLISFDNLGYGRYTLKVRRKRGFGVNNYESLQFPFRVAKLYYQTLAFKLITVVIILLLFGAVLFVRWRLSLIRRKELERVIQEKTEDYRILNQQLKGNIDELDFSQKTLQKIIEDRDRMVAIYAHDIRGPLKHMAYIAERNQQKHEELNAKEIKKWFGVFATTANGIYEQTERMFHWISERSNGMTFEQTEIPLRQMFFESTRFFQNQANSKNIEFNNEVDKDFFLLTDPNVLRIAINNIIDNAIKFTEFGRIDFRAYRDEKNVIISIQDTGVGIGEERLKRLNEGEYSSSSGTKNEKGKGFGLSAIRKLLSEMGGIIKIESEEGKGTSIFIYLPKEERKPSDS